MIFWIFPVVLCHAFCMWHWPTGKDLVFGFEFHLRSSPSAFSGYEWSVDQPINIACYTVLARPNKVETAVHGCNSWLSNWTLSRSQILRVSWKLVVIPIVSYRFIHIQHLIVITRESDRHSTSRWLLFHSSLAVRIFHYLCSRGFFSTGELGSTVSESCPSSSRDLLM